MAPRVLVVEDNPVNLELVTELLEQEGCQVLAAASAEADLRLALAERPDLVLMDIQLPGITGYEAIRQLKANPATAAIPSSPSPRSRCGATTARGARLAATAI